MCAAAIFVPSGYFQSTLRHRVDFSGYITVAWMASSLATVAGALGSILEDEETVREEGACDSPNTLTQQGAKSAKSPFAPLLAL